MISLLELNYAIEADAGDSCRNPDGCDPDGDSVFQTHQASRQKGGWRSAAQQGEESAGDEVPQREVEAEAAAANRSTFSMATSLEEEARSDRTFLRFIKISPLTVSLKPAEALQRGSPPATS